MCYEPSSSLYGLFISIWNISLNSNTLRGWFYCPCCGSDHSWCPFEHPDLWFISADFCGPVIISCPSIFHTRSLTLQSGPRTLPPSCQSHESLSKDLALARKSWSLWPVSASPKEYRDTCQGTPAPLCPREKGSPIPEHEVVGPPWDAYERLGRGAWIPLGWPWSTGNEKQRSSTSVEGTKITWKTADSISRAGKTSQWGGYFIWALLVVSKTIGLRRKVGKQTTLLFQLIPLNVYLFLIMKPLCMSPCFNFPSNLNFLYRK